jgi:hydrogenase nickel incorporation protein HypA/HybF
MHEAGIARDLLKLALDAAARARLGRITALEAKGHGLSEEEAAAVRLHWELAAKETLAEGSRLHLEPAPARAHCLDCGWEGLAEAGACPECGGRDLLEDSSPTLALVSITGE